VRRHIFTKRERANRIYRRIYNAGDKGISVRQISRHERISASRTYYYLRLIRRAQRERGVRIERLDKRFYHVRLQRAAVKAGMAPGPTVWTSPYPGDRMVELRGYLNYTSSSQSARNIDIDCVMLVPYSSRSIVAGSQRIKDKVEARLGNKLASMLKFGVSGATPYSANHFLFRHRGGGWIAF
jgi:hypothetical protein